jgi:formylglycine-generating enzyme required for sulfatase activity
MMHMKSNVKSLAVPGIGAVLMTWALAHVLAAGVTTDTTRPTLTITAPLNNARLSNQLYTVTGRARDNVSVTSVFYQVNNDPWQTASGTTNWSGAATWIPGTNTVRAYAVDATGNRSLTNLVRVTYVLLDRLSVQTIGQGRISPNYSNAVLEIGRSYTVTATPVNGHAFTSWTISTNWSGGVVSNKPALSFIMQSNLTLLATFRDTNRPTLKITTPSNNARLSNQTFTVTGSATDNVAVAGVFYQVNNAPWQAATGTKAWSGAATWIPGTNTVRAYAVDAAGNRSLTNLVRVTYVLFDRLSVQTIGQGRISPNYSNAMLEIGRSYTVTATPVNGHAFTSWTLSTNWSGGVVSNKPALSFIMQSNLTLLATFRDTNRPTLKITTPSNNARLSNQTFTVTGSATDNVAVTGVFYQVNNAPWQAATGTKAWSGAATWIPGTNTVRAYAVDAAGNVSLTNLVRVIYVLSDRLTVLTNGLGSITPNYGGQLLEIGKNYTMSARAGSGYLFQNWTDDRGTLGTGTNLIFQMRSNLVVTAHFVTNIFLAAKGTYNGLFIPTNNPTVTNSGFITLVLSDSGAFKGQMMMAGSSLNITSRFDIAGRALFTTSKAGVGSLLVSLTLAPEQHSIDGWVSNSAWVSDLRSDRLVTNTTLAGKYTFLVEGSADAATSPAGLGAGMVTVSAKGVVQVSATLADGTAISPSSALEDDGVWPLYVPLNGGSGVFMGWMQCRSTTTALWIKPATTNRCYGGGFLEMPVVAMAPYTPPASGRNALNWTNGTIIIGGGNIPARLQSRVSFSNNQCRALSGTISNLTLSVTPSNGLLTASFIHPATGKAVTVKGAVLQNQQGFRPLLSGGWFLGTNQGGYLWMGERFYVEQPTNPNPARLAWIPSGSFLMGSPATEVERSFDETQHRVTLTTGFFMGKTEVTHAEYASLMENSPSDSSNPMVSVTWENATNYCARLTQLEQASGRLPEGWSYRLPTEAEWEYACRAGTETAFHYGSSLLSGMANFNGRLEYDGVTGFSDNFSGIFLNQTTPVASYATNAFGLSDMHGNVWEWCGDWYGFYPGGDETDPQGAASSPNASHVVRGGGFTDDAWACRSACRGSYPSSFYPNVGFRIVLSPLP